MSNEDDKGHTGHKFHLIVNKVEKDWNNQFITGAEVRGLNGSPSDWVVNQLLPGPGNDPEISDSQVHARHLRYEAETRTRA